MEGQGGKKPVGSSSSFPSDLFGSKGSSSSVNANSSSSTGIFDSVFSPPSTILGRREYPHPEVIGSWRKQDNDHQIGSTKEGSPGNTSQSSKGEHHSTSNKNRSSFFQDETVQPSSLSSSLYYGGQDVYSNPSDTRTSGSPPIFKKDGDQDDPNGNDLNSASRGNWWQGSLYY